MSNLAYVSTVSSRRVYLKHTDNVRIEQKDILCWPRSVCRSTVCIDITIYFRTRIGGRRLLVTWVGRFASLLPCSYPIHLEMMVSPSTNRFRVGCNAGLFSSVAVAFNLGMIRISHRQLIKGPPWSVGNRESEGSYLAIMTYPSPNHTSGKPSDELIGCRWTSEEGVCSKRRVMCCYEKESVLVDQISAHGVTA